jgi:UDP-N-acetylmuramate dehydrogenase
VELEYFRLSDGQIIRFKNKDCKFGYRNSIFKNELKDKGVVLSVTLKLNKTPVFKTGYGSIREELEKMEVKQLSIQAIREAVIRIRTSKLPDPEEIGNAGSFFKNPSVDPVKFQELKFKYPKLVFFPQPDGTYKLAAGWLIDQCGWKDYREGDAGVHRNQALVLVNHQNASGKEIFELSEKVRSSVNKRYGVELEREVNVI